MDHEMVARKGKECILSSGTAHSEVVVDDSRSSYPAVQRDPALPSEHSLAGRLLALTTSSY